MQESDKVIRTKVMKTAGLAVAASVAGVMMSAGSAQAAPAVSDAVMDAWNKTIAKTPVPGEGCFTASFPSTSWTEVACVKAPNRLYLPANGTHGLAQTTGDGNDYAAVTSSLTSAALGSFPKVKGLKTETDDGSSNSYSLQLNSNFISSDKACADASNPQKCLGWEQFVYSSDEQAGFMQYWLIYYDTTCPSGWDSDGGGDCYRNSSAVSIPKEVITQLKYLQLSGTAVANGIDTFKLTAQGGKAYSTTGEDSVVYLANGWTASEFNVVGDGGGSEAVFNAGTNLTVSIDLTDGTTKAPTCQAHDGTTGETNNLNLGTCKTKGGTTPSVTFKESLAKN